MNSSDTRPCVRLSVFLVSLDGLSLINFQAITLISGCGGRRQWARKRPGHFSSLPGRNKWEILSPTFYKWKGYASCERHYEPDENLLDKNQTMDDGAEMALVLDESSWQQSFIKTHNLKMPNSNGCFLHSWKKTLHIIFQCLNTGF